MNLTVPNILQVLKAGPLTGRQIAAHFPTRKRLAVAGRLLGIRSGRYRRVRIAGWTLNDGLGGKDFWRPLYALGDRPDALQPQSTAPVRKRRSKPKPLPAPVSCSRRPPVPASIFELARFL